MHRLFDKRKMELCRLLQFEQLPLFAIAASDITERLFSGKRLGIEGVLRILHARKRLLCFPRFDLCAILGRKNLRAL